MKNKKNLQKVEQRVGSFVIFIFYFHLLYFFPLFEFLLLHFFFFLIFHQNFFLSFLNLILTIYCYKLVNHFGSAPIVTCFRDETLLFCKIIGFIHRSGRRSSDVFLLSSSRIGLLQDQNFPVQITSHHSES